MNIRKLFTLLLTFLFVAGPAVWAQESDDDSTDGEFKFPSHGVRFVICSPTNESLPAPLYVKVGKIYVPVRISPRMPSPRITPEKGVVNFYEKAPDTKKEKGERKPGSHKDMPPPFLSIPVPTNHANKSICIVQPKKDGDDPTVSFISETEFTKGGVYVVNLTSTPLEMITSTTGKFEGEEKKTRINPGRAQVHISRDDANVWSYQGSKKTKDRVPFVLRTIPAGPKAEPRRISASVLQTLPTMTQMSFVVDHPTMPGSFKLISIQFSDDSVVKNAARRAAATNN